MLGQDFENVKIAQLSDCFFAWSSSTIQVLEFTQRFMWMAISKGILCRGGIAYGDIIETGNNHNYGRLILGDAVTKAVSFEGHAKGARILTHQDLPQAIFDENKPYSRKMLEFIQEFENPLDYQIYDEFKWYLWQNLNTISDSGPSENSIEDRIATTKARLKLDNHILYSPKFSWNAKNLQGIIHLKATSIFLSDDTLLNVHHKFSRRGFPQIKRTDVRLKRLNKYVDDDQDYYHEN